MRIVRLICSLCLLLVGVVAGYQPTAVSAQEENEEELVMNIKYPRVDITVGETAEFDVELILRGDMMGPSRYFDLGVTGPKDWTVYIQPKFDKTKKISSALLLPGFQAGEPVRVYAAPPFWLKPAPGDYKVTLEASSADVDIKETAELTVVIKARYDVALTPAKGRYNMSATAGKDNYFSIIVSNNSSTAVDNITLSSDKPEDWAVEFKPHSIDTLKAADFQTMDVNVKPPLKAIAGDYMITLMASGKQTSAKALDVRVTVETPTVWGWVGVAIVVAVIAGLVGIFRRFSRR